MLSLKKKVERKIQQLTNQDKKFQAFVLVMILGLFKQLKRVGIVVGIYLAIYFTITILSYILPFGEYEYVDGKMKLSANLTFYIVCYLKRVPLKAFLKRRSKALMVKMGFAA